MEKETRPPFWQKWFEPRESKPPEAPLPLPAPTVEGEVLALDIPPNDPFLAYLLNSSGVIEIERLSFESPTLEKMRQAGVKVSLPLVSQGELIGLLNLGSRMSEQEYTSDDYRLLNTLATQASPALRVAQLARQQLVEALERERMAYELRVARVIQETLLPKQISSLEGWVLAVFWKPAREVGGDFYDFITMPDGQIGVLIADVTDKGVPAAIVMATTRSILRAAAERLISPGQVLARANEVLHPDIPAKMFVTCLYLVFDPATGHMVYANAGHNLPYLSTAEGVVELRATGMPLGLLPGMPYDEKEVTLRPGETVVLSSDGLIEAHNPARQMFGFPRLRTLMAAHPAGAGMIAHIMADFDAFTGSNYEQEDDITLLTLERLPVQNPSPQEFAIPSQPGNERLAAAQVIEAVQPLHLPEARLKKLETAVAEATMNAMEHGNKYQADIPVKISVEQRNGSLIVRITDQGGGVEIPSRSEPDLDAKLAGEQSPRGWGLFLIKHMVDEMNVSQDSNHYTIELILHDVTSRPA